MPTPRLDRICRALGLVALLILPTLAAAEVTVLIDGAAYPAELRENLGLLARIHMPRSANARHVEGELRGVPGSWIRASLIGHRWQGVVALDGKHYVIDSPTRSASSGGLWLTAESPEALARGGSCGVEAPLLEAKAATAATFTTAPATFASLCQTTVNGVCLLPELEIAFDRLFLGLPNYQQQAAALLNIVDGYYKNDLNMQFDAITMSFLTTDVFSITTDSSALLTDIQNKKNSGQIPSLVTNNRALFHLVTGRTFNGNIVGLGAVGSLCAVADNASTSQYTSNSIAVTALVVAHELGHNFGAIHDGAPGNTCGPGFIMAPQISSGVTQFSSCSISEIKAGIGKVASPALCFEFPVDASLVARPGNPTTAGANTDFTLSYDVDEVNASVPASQLTVTGSLTGAAGMFVSANVNGIACTVPAGGATYSCSTSSAGGLLGVTARVNGSGSINVQSTVAASTAGSIKDVNPANDSVTNTVVAGTPPAAPSMLTAVADAGGAARIDLNWSDNSGNETGFRVEREAGAGAFQQIVLTAANVTSYADAGGLTAGVAYTYRVSAVGAGGTSAPATSAATQLVGAPAKAAGGGGGGGSFGIELAPLLLLTALRRRQRER